jgi:HEAT repeat protein
MRKPSNVTKIKTDGTVRILGFCVVFATALAVFVPGCEEALQTGARQPKAGSIESLIPKANQIILQALADVNPQVRSNAIEVIASTKQIKLMPKVQKLLQDQAIPVRFLAILAVGDLKYSLAKDEISGLLRDENENIRIAAAYTMYRLGHKEYLNIFRNAIASDDQTVRANAAFLLGKSGDTGALRFLWWAMRHKDSDDKVVFNAIESIAMLGDEQILERAWAMLIKVYADERVMGVRTMGALGTIQAKNALITMLDDSVPEVRLAAAEQLGKLGDSIGEEVVQEVFKKNLIPGIDDQGQERIKALTALAISEIGTEKLTGYLPKLLEDESKFVRIAAAKAVFQCAKNK